MFEFSFPFQLNVGPLHNDKFLSWSRIDCSPRRRKRMQLPKCVLVRAGSGPNPTRNLTRGSRVFKNPNQTGSFFAEPKVTRGDIFLT